MCDIMSKERENVGVVFEENKGIEIELHQAGKCFSVNIVCRMACEEYKTPGGSK